jgi:hypothetical protein
MANMGERSMTAPPLSQYGIHTEQSDIRAHVSVINQSVYVFPTSAGVAAVREHNPPIRSATQPGVMGSTAEGWLVRPEWINGLQIIKPKRIQWETFTPELTTSQKGKLAVRVVCYLMKVGRFPLWINAEESQDRDVQLSGADIVVCCKRRVQVKCDYYAGPRPGTGNLFLQKAECNPRGLF